MEASLRPPSLIAAFTDPGQAHAAVEAAIREGASADHLLILMKDPEKVSDAGAIPVKSIDEPAETVKKGLAVGVGVGALAATAALAVPGLGMLVGGSLIAASVAATTKQSQSGGQSGGVVNFLADRGVPAEEMDAFLRAYNLGGAIAIAEIASGSGKEPVDLAFHRYGADRILRI